MSKNMLTTKEATLLSDLLIYEESAYKKAKLYSKITTNQKLASEFDKLAQSHKQRFTELFDLL